MRRLIWRFYAEESLGFLLTLPPATLEILSKRLEGISISELQEARASLSHVYKTHTGTLQDFAFTPLQVLSYLATRLPATYTVCMQVLQILQQRNFTPQSVLDVGAGPGTASLACCEIFPSISSLSLYDREPLLKDLALQFLTPYAAAPRYHLSDLLQVSDFTPSDLVICSYALGEILPENREEVLKKIWKAAQKVLVLIEPGTPFGFSVIKEARFQLIARAGKVVAPCTHENTCPLLPQDWCHFAVRLERSPFHKKIKKGALGYEDEKYAYLMLSKDQLFSRSEERVIRPVLQGTGHVTLDVCGPEGLRREIISKRQKELYQKTRKLRWGDVWSAQEKKT